MNNNHHHHNRSMSTNVIGGTSSTTSSSASMAIATTTITPTINVGMDGVRIIRQYVDKMVQLNHHSHSMTTTTSNSSTNITMKALLLDNITTQIISSVYTQSELLLQHIYYITTLEKSIVQKKKYTTTTWNNDNNSQMNNNNNSHLTAICFIRPTPQNIELLCQEIQISPQYAEYHIYFTGTVSTGTTTTTTNSSTVLQQQQSPSFNNNNTNNLRSNHRNNQGSSSSSSNNSKSTNSHLRRIAECDIYEKVKHIYEYYADFVPCNVDCWSIQCSTITSSTNNNSNTKSPSSSSTTTTTIATPSSTMLMSMSAGTSYAPQYATLYERHISSICHMLLALKRYPTYIRYTACSPCTEEMAYDIYDIISNDDRYHFRTTGSNSITSNNTVIQQHNDPINNNNSSNSSNGGFVVFIIDRREDPVTPLLSQWTYQSMVHELLGLNNHRVILRGAPGIQNNKELEEVILSDEDEFYKQHKYSNFGVLGEAIQQLLQDYQQQSTSIQSKVSSNQLTTVADIQQFMEKYPELRSRSHVVSKHVAIMGELARLVQTCSLMDVSQFEQTLACQDDHNAHWRELLEKLESTTIKIPDKLRLSLLYALRYETSANLHMLQQMMSKGGVPQNMISYISTILRYSGYQQRTPNRLYAESHNIMSRMTKHIVGAVAGVDNIYAQHVPLIVDLVQQLLRGKLSHKDYPILTATKNNNMNLIASGQHQRSSSMNTPSATTPNNNNNNLESMIPEEILVFMVGGVTYEEGMKIAELNQSFTNKKIRIVLAGSTIHNSTSFLDELRTTAM